MIIKLLWALCSSLIIILSIYFTYYLKCPQFKIKDYILCFRSKKDYQAGIRPIQSLMLTLGGRIGVGSIAGVALAIYMGGEGVIFWIWVICILSLPLAFLETTLSSFYKKRENNEYIGGPSYYLSNGLKRHKLSKAYSFLMFISFLFGFLGIQVNTIIKVSNIDPFIISFILLLLTITVIIGGVYKISSFLSKIVPFMIICYILLSIFVTFKHLGKMPLILSSIFKSAFRIKPFFSSFLYTMIIGIQRGIFSSEVGLGTGSITSASSSSLVPKKDGYLQMLSIIITTIICTSTSIFILTSPYQSISIKDVNGIEITLHAFLYHFSSYGFPLLFLFIFLVSFSTILTGYYNALTSLKFLFKKNVGPYLIISTSIMILASSFLSSSFLWHLVDLFTACLIFINLYAIYKLKEKVKNVLS